MLVERRREERRPGLATNRSEVIGTFGSVLDAALAISCAARLGGWTSASLSTNDKELEARLSVTTSKRRPVDVVVVCGQSSTLVTDIEQSLPLVAPNGALFVTAATAKGTARVAIALLRARYDVDVASVSTYDGGLAVVLRRPNSKPLALEGLPSNVIDELQWDLSEAKPNLASFVDRNLDLLRLVEATVFFDFIRHNGRPPATKESLARSFDATNWREICFEQLEADPRVVDCFRLLAARFGSPTDYVHLALALSASGRPDEAATAAHHAFNKNRRLAAALFKRAASSLAPWPRVSR